MRETKLVNSIDFDYVITYSVELFSELLEKEKKNVISDPNFFTDGKFQHLYGSYAERAYIVDKFFLIGSYPGMSLPDKSIIFQAVSILDRVAAQRYKKLREVEEMKLPPILDLSKVKSHQDFLRIEPE